MLVAPAVPVVLTASERHRLKKTAYGHKTPYQARQRATIVLLAARGRSNTRIAARTQMHVDTVRTWRGRFAADGLPALADRKRSGRPPSFRRCEPKTGIVPFMNLVTQVMTTEPYASARRVFWIVDNGSSHRGQKAIDRLTTAFPNAVMVHTPVHASWTNQIEIFFSIVQHKVGQPNDFTDLTQVRDRLLAFEDRYNAKYCCPAVRPDAVG
ncbi:helix-turn-helix domain-containing protein [Streptomyces laculatispora]|uniref:helix-turn-helix domain-containing protein n=1 Tax=Streptomyces laculatispora TaxID=887464 RepID=UPI0027DBE47A|nr:helix-turn-helix domain-containing protein [Streptomyces laculatispora]